MNGSGINENKSLPMLWSSINNNGITYSPTNSTQTTEGTIRVDEQIKDINSLLNYYKEILIIKAKNPEIARGELVHNDVGDREIAAYSVSYKDKTVYVLHNLSKSDKQISSDIIDINDFKISDYLITNKVKPKVSNGKIYLPSMSTVIIR